MGAMSEQIARPVEGFSTKHSVSADDGRDGSRSVTLRDEQAMITRARVLSAASTLFLNSGYVDTSVSAIAAEANVAVQTIYNSVGSKVALLSAILDQHASGPNAPSSVPEFMRERMDRSADVAEMLDVLADWFVEVWERTVDVWSLLQQAAAVDREAADLARGRSEQRLRNYGIAAATLRERGGLTQVTDTEAAATIWTIGHPNTYLTLVRDQGWSVVDYRSWLRTSLAGALR